MSNLIKIKIKNASIPNETKLQECLKLIDDFDYRRSERRNILWCKHCLSMASTCRCPQKKLNFSLRQFVLHSSNNVYVFKCSIDILVVNIIKLILLPKQTSPCNSCSGFLVFYDFATRSIENNKNVRFSANPPHKMWEKPFK